MNWSKATGLLTGANLANAIDAAIAEEREACAKAIEFKDGHGSCVTIPDRIWGKDVSKDLVEIIHTTRSELAKVIRSRSGLAGGVKGE